MSESFIPASEFETASNAVSNILGQPVEEIKITDILPPLNDMRNDLLEEERPTDIVDEVLLKVIDAPAKKVRCRNDEARE